MNYLRGFIPWIVFAAMPSKDLKVAALVALAVAAVLFRRQRRRGVDTDALILEIGTIAFFAVLAAVAYALPHVTAEIPYTGALSFAWLAVIAWGSLIASHPFTLGIARQSVPQEMWHSPQFMKVNVVITAVWAVFFTLTAAAVAACVAAGLGEAASLACEAVGFAAPAIFTRSYPKIVQARYAKASAGVGAGVR
jgi:hypothetical protein